MEATPIMLSVGWSCPTRTAVPQWGSKIDKLTEHVKKHSCLVELAYRPEQDMTVTRRNVDPLYEKMDR